MLGCSSGSSVKNGFSTWKNFDEYLSVPNKVLMGGSNSLKDRRGCIYLIKKLTKSKKVICGPLLVCNLPIKC